MEKTIKGIIFDFNGTLVKDTHLHNEAWDIFLNDRNVRLSDNEKLNFMHGKSNREIFDYIFPSRYSDKIMESLAEEKEAIYRQIFVETNTKLLRGAEELFCFLKEHKIPFVIATSSGKTNVDFFVETLHLDKYFKAEALIYNDGRIPGKPDPLIFLKAMKVLGLPANEVLIFEDSPSGILGAQRSGAGSIVIVDTNNNNFTNWNYPVIKDFTEFDSSIL